MCKKYLIPFCISILVIVTPKLANASDSIILSQKGSPIEITTYSARYSRSDKEILHRISVKNITDQVIVAFQISFLAFDVFKENMGRRLGGVEISRLYPGNEFTKLTWSHRPYAAFMFDHHGIGVAFVSKVRLENGNIWTFNEDYILEELRKIKEDLTGDVFENQE